MSQRLSQGNRDDVDLSVTERGYYGYDLSGIRNASTFGLRGTRETTAYRVSYVYLEVFGNNDASTEYGGIQLRSHCYLHLEEGQVPTRLQRAIQQSAHRAGYMYDSDVQTSAYGYSGDTAGRGFLSGFGGGETGETYSNWEVEPVAGGEMGGRTPGKIDWSVEVYWELDGLDLADLAGKADGVADPWDLETTHVEGEEAVSVAPHKWEIDYYPESRPDYYEIRPPSYEAARDRYRDGAGAGKNVRINGRHVGEIDNAGRMWLRKEYARGDGLKHGSRYSRKGLVEETGATYQAIRDGGTLYLTGETETTIDLVTAAEKPPGYKAADPSAVSTTLQTKRGRVSDTVRTLSLRDPPESTIRVECRSDRDIAGIMGWSDPTYWHELGPGQQYPEGGVDYRPIETHGTIRTPADERDDEQEGLGR